MIGLGMVRACGGEERMGRYSGAEFGMIGMEVDISTGAAVPCEVCVAWWNIYPLICLWFFKYHGYC